MSLLQDLLAHHVYADWDEVAEALSANALATQDNLPRALGTLATHNDVNASRHVLGLRRTRRHEPRGPHRGGGWL